MESISLLKTKSELENSAKTWPHSLFFKCVSRGWTDPETPRWGCPWVGCAARIVTKLGIGGLAMMFDELAEVGDSIRVPSQW